MQWRRAPDAYRRTPTFADPVATVREVLVAARERFPGRADDFERLSTLDEVRRMARNSPIDALRRPAPMVRDVLASRGLAIIRITLPQKSFVTASFPVVKLTRPGNTDLRDPEVEMWLPIAHDRPSAWGERTQLRSLSRRAIPARFAI
jgi:hypothetical protein